MLPGMELMLTLQPRKVIAVTTLLSILRFCLTAKSGHRSRLHGIGDVQHDGTPSTFGRVFPAGNVRARPDEIDCGLSLAMNDGDHGNKTWLLTVS